MINQEMDVWMDGVHKCLIKHQTIEELRRKQRKAQSKGFWTQEDIDLAEREAEEICNILHWG